MKILLAGKFVPTGPRPIGGLQSWIKTVRAELERRGHNCAEWQPNQNLAGAYDIGIFANLALTKHGLSHCGKVICVSHGIIEAERPEPGIGRQVFTSEGVRDHWGIPGEVIRQPIDLGFWRPGVDRRSQVTRYSYRTAPILGLAAATELGMPYRHVMDVTPIQARDALRSSRLVYASGRAALEAMACGTPTVIYDHRSSYQGELLGIDLEREMKNNYSGRAGIESPTLESVLMHSELAMKADHWREWVDANHNVRDIVDDLLELC